jgi:putative ABC transport system substrate-binding protein
MEVTPVNVRDAREIERSVATFAQASNGGLIATASALTVVHRDLIIRLAARHKLPSVFHRRLFVASGGLMSYGSDVIDQFRQAAGYVDRIRQGRETGRPAGTGADHVRTGHQSLIRSRPGADLASIGPSADRLQR